MKQENKPKKRTNLIHHKDKGRRTKNKKSLIRLKGYSKKGEKNKN
jgi:hypothetical protein